mmetsp:Transcript_66958/g.135763  ORF Transcript_66958/g.135763 Transcript_66958/m.135763 type:complete len:92 (+) Transcript_66958:147-422(+)
MSPTGGSSHAWHGITGAATITAALQQPSHSGSNSNSTIIPWTGVRLETMIAAMDLGGRHEQADLHAMRVPGCTNACSGRVPSVWQMHALLR